MFQHDKIILNIVIKEIPKLKLYKKDKDNFIEFEQGRKIFKLIRIK